MQIVWNYIWSHTFFGVTMITIYRWVRSVVIDIYVRDKQIFKLYL